VTQSLERLPEKPGSEKGKAHASAKAAEYRGSLDVPLDAATLLYLQHQAGNAATSDLLTTRSRAAAPATGPITTAGPPDVRAGKGTPMDGVLAGRQSDLLSSGLVVQTWGIPVLAAAPARTSQTVSITNVSGPKDLGRGGFDWKVWFNIGTAAGTDGWVIQEINASFKTEGAGGSTRSYHFWEAWQLKKGKTQTIYQDESLDDNDDQYYSAPAATGSKGSNKVVGNVKFYEGALPADFKTNNPSTVAGILNSTTTKPDFWDGSGTDHSITATWDDTASPSKHTVKAVMGSTNLDGT